MIKNFAAHRTTATVSLIGWIALVLLVASQASAEKLPVQGLQFSPDGKYLAAISGSSDPRGPIAFWNVKDWNVAAVIDSQGGGLCLDFSPTGDRLVFGTKQGEVGIVEVASRKSILAIEAHTDRVNSVAFTPDGDFVLSGGADRNIHLWDANTGEQIASFAGHADVIYSIAISPDGNTLVSTSKDRTVRQWDVASSEEQRPPQTSELLPRRVTLSSDGKHLLLSRYDGRTHIWEQESGRLRAQLPHGSQCADITQDSHLVAVSDHSSSAYVFAVALHEPTEAEREKCEQLLAALHDESYDTRRQAEEKIVELGMIAVPMLTEAMDADNAEVRVRARSLRQKLLAPEPLAKLSGHTATVGVLAFSVDGEYLATGDWDGKIKVWDTSDFAKVATLEIPVSNNAPSR